jgi:hypothetical protein
MHRAGLSLSRCGSKLGIQLGGPQRVEIRQAWLTPVHTAGNNTASAASRSEAFCSFSTNLPCEVHYKHIVSLLLV